MAKRSESFESSLRALAAEDRRELGEHPAVEELTAYHAGELEGAAREQLRDHLALCPECTGLLLDLASFGAETPDDEEQRPAARVLPFEARAADPPPPRVETVIPGWYHAVAAVLVAAVVGLTFWGIGLSRQVDDVDRPRVIVHAWDLEPLRDGARRGGGGEESFEVPASTDTYLLHLGLAEARTFDGYRVEIRAADGRLVWDQRVPRSTRFGDFPVIVPGDFLAPGAYEVHLYGEQGGEPERLASYTFQLKTE